jgi:hypothetical protein
MCDDLHSRILYKYALPISSKSTTLTIFYSYHPFAAEIACAIRWKDLSTAKKKIPSVKAMSFIFEWVSSIIFYWRFL